MKAREYVKKREELDFDYRQKLDALAIVWKMFNPDTPLPEVNPETGKPAWRFEITKRDAAHQAMETLKGTFQTKDVRFALEQINDEWAASLDDDELSSLVARIVLNSENKFVIAEPKAGRSPAKYRRIGEGGE
jgi:hypothetical protein